MKSKIQIFTSLLLGLVLSLNAYGQVEKNDQSLSPYFKINTPGIDSEEFPLLSTTADVNITGPIADVTVTQLYKNNGDLPIEAIYVFPASTRAAVYAMTMEVGDRIINAEIKEKKEARATYEKAKRAGKRASLLEQKRPNVFQMNIGNMLPGDLIKVELKYNEFLIPENKVYSFIYPTVVGPRFVSPEETQKDVAFANMPYTKETEEPSYDFYLTARINAGMPIASIASSSHDVQIDKIAADQARIKLDPGSNKSGNKDFILNYSLSGELISSGTMLYNHGDEQFFLTMIQPPKRITTDQIPPREYVFIIDVSGSMRGFPIDISKGVIKDLVGKLRPIDKFNMLLFSGGSKVFAEKSVLANEGNLTKAFSFLDNINAGGGTQLLPAMRHALALPSDDEINSRSMVIVTDGYVSVEREAFNLIADNLNKSNLFAFGIGSSVNRHLIEGMAHAGRGEAFVITNKSEAPEIAKKFRTYIETPILTNIDLNIDGIQAYDIIPKTVPDLLAERPLFVFGKFKGDANGSIKFTGYQGKKKYVERINISPSMESKENSPIRYLWAREQIRWKDDLNSLSQSEGTVQEVTNLGLKYNLLTKYTSFVAVEKESVMKDGSKTIKVKQPLPLPEGVSNHAVGFEMKMEGNSKHGAKQTKQVLFVHVTGNAIFSFKNNLKKQLVDNIEFDKKEKAILNGNVLTIHYNTELNKWSMQDSRNQLTPAFIKQFEALLKTLTKNNSNSFTIQVNFLWV